MKELNETIQSGILLGKKAFENGIDFAPCLDPDLMAKLQGRKVGDKYNIVIMTAWSQGWIEANLTAPI